MGYLPEEEAKKAFIEQYDEYPGTFYRTYEIETDEHGNKQAYIGCSRYMIHEVTEQEYNDNYDKFEKDKKEWENTNA